jgi:hypothetical protein
MLGDGYVRFWRSADAGGSPKRLLSRPLSERCRDHPRPRDIRKQPRSWLNGSKTAINHYVVTLSCVLQNSCRPCGKLARADSAAAYGAVESSMTHISGHDRSQMLLLPESVDDYVGVDNPVRFIDAQSRGGRVQTRHAEGDGPPRRAICSNSKSTVISTACGQAAGLRPNATATSSR